MIYADPPDWEDSPGQYEYTAYVVGVVFYEDEQMADEGDLFAAFDDDGNVRGLGIGVFVPFGPYANSTLWELPAWFFPESKPALTYHGKMDRWQRKEENVLLKSASRGQEFILQTEHYPEAKSWLNEIGLTLPGSK